MAAYPPSPNNFNPFFIDICGVSSGMSSIVVLSLLHPAHYPYCSQFHTLQGCICVYMIMHGFFEGCILTHFVPLHFLYSLDHFQQSCSSCSLSMQCPGSL